MRSKSSLNYTDLLQNKHIKKQTKSWPLWAKVLGVLTIVCLTLIGYLFFQEEEKFSGSMDWDYQALTTTAETLPIREKLPATAYSREEQFGKPWIDVWETGCDTRNNVLKRDLDSVNEAPDCKILSGVLDDPYTGKLINFERGENSALVQIDHVVALKDAWDSGADKLTQEQRLEIANDPDNLLAVDGPANQAKGAKTLDEWMPDNLNYACDYAARQVLVKAKYSLSVTKAEKAQMIKVLSSCSDSTTSE